MRHMAKASCQMQEQRVEDGGGTGGNKTETGRAPDEHAGN